MMIVITGMFLILVIIVDPISRINHTRNTRRAADIVAVVEAVNTYQIDNAGTHYSPIEEVPFDTSYVLGTCEEKAKCSDEIVEDRCMDISGIGQFYLPEMPKDPIYSNKKQSKYFLRKESKGGLTIGACEPERVGRWGQAQIPSIRVTR